MEEIFISKEFFSENKFGLYDYVVYYWGLNVVGFLGLIGVFIVDFGFFIKIINDVSLSEVFDEGFIEIKEIVNVFMVLFFLENVIYYLLFEVLNELINFESSFLVDDGKNIEECIWFF